jgi:Endonuclease NucS
MYQRDAFQIYFVETLGGKPTTFPSYRSYLNRIDELSGGLDELIQQVGLQGTRDWAKQQTTGPFGKYSADARSILNSYLGFISSSDSVETSSVPDIAESAQSPQFKVEREMQLAIRSDLSAIEAGLVAIDEGVEVTTAVGRIDILARDITQKLVVIELKVGACPTGAIEQVQGYAHTLSEEWNEPTRTILIAGSFNPRLMAAAKRIPELQLASYTYQMAFTAVS